LVPDLGKARAKTRAFSYAHLPQIDTALPFKLPTQPTSQSETPTTVASKPNDLAGKRRGFRSRNTPGNRNKNGIKPIGLDTHKSNTPGWDCVPTWSGREWRVQFVGFLPDFEAPRMPVSVP
jgi:hypothetical protein